jgi:MFS family permease
VNSVDHSDRWFLSALFANVAQGGSSLLIPLFASSVLGATVGEVGLITGLASLVGVLASLGWGRLSDRWGVRKPFVLIGFLGLTLSLVLMGLSRSVGQMIALNALLNFTWLASAAVVTLLAITGRTHARWESHIGALHRQMGTGWVLGLILGSLWTGPMGIVLLGSTEASMRPLFFALAGLAAVGTFLAAHWITEYPIPHRVQERRFQGLTLAAGQVIERFKFAPFRLYHIAHPRRIWDSLRGGNDFGPALTRYFYAVVVIFTGFSMFFIPYPIFLKDVLHVSSGEIFALWVVHSGASAYFNSKVGQLVERWASRRVQLSALMLRACVFVLAGLLLPQLADQRGWAIGLIGFFFLLTGLSWAGVNITAIALISRMAREGLRGQALGTYNALAGLGSFLGAIAGGQIAQFSYPANFTLAAALVLLGWLLVRRSFSREYILLDSSETPVSAPVERT